MKRISVVLGKHTILLALLAIGFLVVARSGSYWIGQADAVLYTAVALLGLTLTTGHCGLVSLGHGAFFTMGAYAAGLLAADAGWPLYLTVLPAALLTFLLGYLFAVPALRLSGPYLGLITLALAVIVPPLVQRYSSITHGFQGFSTPPTPQASGITADQLTLLVLLVATYLAALVAYRLASGSAGRAMREVRDNELVAATLGVRVRAVKRLAFATGAGFAGVAGALYVYAVGYLSSDSIAVTYGVTLLAAATVGGLRFTTGAFIGALFAVWVPTEAAHISNSLGPLIFAGTLILVLFLCPGGVADLARRALRGLAGRRGPNGRPDPAEGCGSPATNSADADHDETLDQPFHRADVS